MKQALKIFGGLTLGAVLALGITLTPAPEAEARVPCPPCYVPDGATNWTVVGSCLGGPKYSPIYYDVLRKNSDGQMCRAEFGVPI